MKNKIFLVLVMLIMGSLTTLSCWKERTIYVTNPDNENNNDDSNTNNDNIEFEKSKIVDTYVQFSEMLLIKNYSAALACLTKGSAAELDLNHLKNYWDEGKVAYYLFTNIQGVIDQPLRYGMGGATGDAKIVRGSQVLTRKFTSSCSRENNQWLIHAFFFE